MRKMKSKICVLVREKKKRQEKEKKKTRKKKARRKKTRVKHVFYSEKPRTLNIHKTFKI